MTIDEAIEHAKEVARTCDDSQCAAEHIQLAEWLKKARIYEKCKKLSVSMIRKLKEENDRLQWKLEVLKDYGIEIVDAVAGGYEIYSYDHKDAQRLKHQNEKLRELLRKLGHFEKFGCHECPYEGPCAKSIYDVDCSMRLEIEKEMRELGIEVK